MIKKSPLTEAAKRAIHRQAPDGVRRQAKAAECRRCGVAIMRGLDGDALARAVAVDVAPLSPAGELAALVAGRLTYALAWVPGRAAYEINARFPDMIEHQPPGTVPNSDVVVAHLCHAAPLDVLNTNHVRRDSGALPREAPF
jgi:hypothetical protein